MKKINTSKKECKLLGQRTQRIQNITFVWLLCENKKIKEVSLLFT